MDTFAPEYTPELSKSFLDSIMGGIDDQARVDEGRAVAEHAARGTLGQDIADSAIGNIRAGVRRDKANAIGAFNLDVANKTREERLMKQNRGYAVEDRDFAAVEAQKNRDFQKMMAQLGYQYGDASARRDMIYGQQGAVMGAGLKLATDGGAMGIAKMMGMGL